MSLDKGLILEEGEIYVYTWHEETEVDDATYIRVYGLNVQNENVCVSINGFRPFVYIELPLHITWDKNNEKRLQYFFTNLLHTPDADLRCNLVWRRKLNGAHLKPTKDGGFEHCTFPYLKCTASVKKHIYYLIHKLKQRHFIEGLGYNMFKVHEQDACPRLQLTSKYNLPTSSWIKFKGYKIVNSDEKFLQGCIEYIVELTNTADCYITRSARTATFKPLILSFDLEVNSGNGITMPKATCPDDVVFQISCVFHRLGDLSSMEKMLLSLGHPDENLVGANVRTFPTEQKLLMGFKDLVLEKNPNIITGYNIFSFDIPYLIDRSHFHAIFPEWSVQGFPKDRCGIERQIKWSSAAFKDQNFKYLECEGRLYIDLLPVVQRDFKLDNYKLKTVSSKFIGDTKHDLSPKGIFKCFREGIKDTRTSVKYMSTCGRYCMQDSILVTKLFEKLNVWYGLSEMATVCNVPMITLFTKGQQIKVYSTLYKYCLEQKIVVEKDGYITQENERYVGAYVFPPFPGLYKNVIPMDFCSLYPTLIISYNIDYSTFVTDLSIPDEMCHIMEWEDHVGCKHDPKIIEKNKLTQTIDALVSSKGDKTSVSKLRKERSEITKSLNKNVLCEKRFYRFLKATDPKYIGVLPHIVQQLLDARKHTRSEIAKLKESLQTTNNRHEVEMQISILNQRQLAYKVSANSMYGITGVKSGLLPFMPVAMTITYMGRKNIGIVADTLQTKYNAKLIYGDTDSCYVSFPKLGNNIQKLWDHAVRVADEISHLFPPPMKLEFEDAIYTKFLILTKKRYIYRACARDGTIKPEIGKRGVVLNRRDNSSCIRNIYEKMVQIIFDEDDIRIMKDKVLKYLTEAIYLLMCGVLPTSDFVITKNTGDYGDLTPQLFVNEKGVNRAMVGQYNVPYLTDEMRDEITTQDKMWYLDKLPAHVQLLEKIKSRGHIKNEGSRLEYVILDTDTLDDKQCNKIEALDYYKKNKDVLRLDYLYYLHRLINPVDQILEVIFNLDNFIKNQYKIYVAKKKMILQIKDLFAPEIRINMDTLHICKHPSGSETRYIITEKRSPKDTVYTFQCALSTNELYKKLSQKYGKMSKLKTKFIFSDGKIALGDSTESKLIYVVKKMILTLY